MKLKKVLAGAVVLAMAATLTVNMAAYDEEPADHDEEQTAYEEELTSYDEESTDYNEELMAETDDAPAAVLDYDALDVKTDGNFEYIVLEDGTVSIIHYNGTDKEVTIPKTIDGKDVTQIGERAFFECGSLTKITVPDTVTEIGSYAFGACRFLSEIKLSNKLISISHMMFWDCLRLVKIEIPESVTSIETQAFYTCESLAEIVIPDSVKKIGSGAFSHCKSLVDVKLPESIESSGMGTRVFEFCSKLPYVELPSGVTWIVYKEFEGCTSLADIVIPETVESIHSSAFPNSPLKEIIGYLYPDPADDTASEKIYASEKYAKEAGIEFIPVTLGLDKEYLVENGSKIQLMYTKETLFGNGGIDLSVSGGIEAETNSRIYKLTLTTNDGVEVQPSGKVVIKTPNHWNTRDVSVYKNDADGKLSKIDSIISGGKIIWITDTFGAFTVKEDNSSSTGSETTSSSVSEPEEVVTQPTSPEYNYPPATWPQESFVTTTAASTTTEPEETTATTTTASTTAEPEITTTTAAATTVAPTTQPVPVPELVGVDEKTGVQLLAEEGVLEKGVEMNVVIGNADITADTHIYVLDITLVNVNGEYVQPNGNVTVRIPLPEGFESSDTYYVYYQADDGTLTDMHATFENGYVSFITNHFSTYILATSQLTEQTANTTTTANEDRNVNTGAVLLVLPAIAAAAGVIISKKRK